jgi:hypothetical protein
VNLSHDIADAPRKTPPRIAQQAPRPGTGPPTRFGGPRANPRSPGGIKRELVDVAAAAREHTPAAIAALAAIVNNPKAAHVAIVAAAKVLLDRAWGTAPQTIELRLFQRPEDAIVALRAKLLELGLVKPSAGEPPLLNGTAEDGGLELDEEGELS